MDDWELYDLKNDPHEVNNLINDDKLQPLVLDLKRRFEGITTQVPRYNVAERYEKDD